MTSIKRPLLALLLATGTGGAAGNIDLDAIHPGASDFVAEMVAEHDADAAELTALLAGAQRRQDILDAISRPAEAKPWHQYRPIFMTEQRITEGLAFWRENEALLDRVEAEFGVPAQIIVAIVGVETAYGRITGRYRVIDALATLAFHYPPRAGFFRRELAHFIQLGDEEGLPLDEVQGSYAGAMGLGQFIASSYRSYAVDFDRDERRDLWGSREDAIASVANYFRRHGWQTGAPVTVRARAAEGAALPEPLPLKPSRPVADLAAWGFTATEPLDPELPATVIELDSASGPEYWIGLQNFYVISRYNRSALYSMAVWQLSQAIAERRAEAVGP